MEGDDCSTSLASLVLETMAHTQGLYSKSDSSLHVLTAPLVVLDTACAGDGTDGQVVESPSPSNSGATPRFSLVNYCRIHPRGPST